MEKKKVIFITRSLQAAGVDKSLVTALNAVDTDRYEVYVYPFGKKAGLASELKDGVKVVLPDGRPHKYGNPRSIALLAAENISNICGRKKAAEKFNEKLIEHKRDVEVAYYAEKIKKTGVIFDTVVAYDFDLSYLIAPLVPAGKHVFFYHGSRDIFKDASPHPFEKYDKIVAVGSGVREMLREAYPRYHDKFELLTNIVDADEIKAKAKGYAPKIEEARLIIATCGRISREKGCDLAVKAAEILKNDGVDFRWYLIGGGPMEKEIEADIEKRGLSDRVKVTGFLKNPLPYVAACDVYVQPSYEESFALTIAEALALSKPVVSTATVGAVDQLSVISDKGLTDFTPEALAEGIKTVLGDDEIKKSFREFAESVDMRARHAAYGEKLNQILS